MSFEITILGSGAALPTARRNPTSQYVNCNERHILIDCGEGTQNQLRRYAIKIQKIKYILISHLHGDHYFGLIGLLSTMNLLGRNADIHLFAPAALKEIIDLQLKASGHHYDFGVHFHPLQTEKPEIIFEDRMLEIQSFPLKHRVPTCGFVIREKKGDYKLIGEKFRGDGVSLLSVPFFRQGKDFVDERGKRYKAKDYTIPPPKPRTYAYFSDTAVDEKNLQFATEADALYHEATFTNKHEDRAKNTHHSTAQQAAQFAGKAKVNKLYLGHISSRYESTEVHLSEAQACFENVVVVEDGYRFRI